MIIRVLAEGEVCEVPITPETTCADVIDCVRDPGDETCTLLQTWGHGYGIPTPQAPRLRRGKESYKLENLRKREEEDDVEEKESIRKRIVKGEDDKCERRKREEEEEERGGDEKEEKEEKKKKEKKGREEEEEEGGGRRRREIKKNGNVGRR
ncbi:hypothetical protein LSTR_LSTR003434 [Laodelphax striatellus]|uniref:Ras association domain-containing protein n=1 Tax=Laodelphax striatellus TaxID=195883 RepID=A0A482X203_LAOST|nr:hypothetical protein LSTR_LSTR003434 [Laodelphax striatellus]